jgi:transketolase
MASGSLGQGLSVALGAAQGKKLDGDNLWFTLSWRWRITGRSNLGSIMYAAGKK